MKGRASFGQGSYAELAAAVATIGLSVRGGFQTAPEDAVRDRDGRPARTLVLIGAVGDSHWPAFSRAQELRDGDPDPLDRWSRRVIETLATGWRARALFPFGGPPHWPFQQWALRAESLHESPIGLLIHPRFGLWHSYRGALAFDRLFDDLPLREDRPNPCVTCRERPCLTACPVDAFSLDGYARRYDTGRCGAYLAGPAKEGCLSVACQARAACPVGAAYRYRPEAARFHMAAFKRSLEGQPGEGRATPKTTVAR